MSKHQISISLPPAEILLVEAWRQQTHHRSLSSAVRALMLVGLEQEKEQGKRAAKAAGAKR